MVLFTVAESKFDSIYCNSTNQKGVTNSFFPLRNPHTETISPMHICVMDQSGYLNSHYFWHQRRVECDKNTINTIRQTGKNHAIF